MNGPWIDPLCRAEVDCIEPGEHALDGCSICVKLRLAFQDDCTVAGIKGELGVIDPRGGWSRFADLEPVLIYTPDRIPGNGQRLWEFRAVVDARTLERVNATRSGDDVTLQFRVCIAFAIGENLRSRREVVPHRIAASDWMKLLEQLGVCETLAIEMPLPRDEVGGHLARASGYLRDARRLLLASKWADAVAQVRKALDAARDWRGDAEAIKAVGGGQLGSLRTRGLAERLHLVRFAIEKMADPATHGDEVAAAFPWDHASARAVVALAIAVISAYATDEQ